MSRGNEVAHWPSAKRLYRGELAADELIQWLNTGATTKAKRTVAGMIDCVHGFLRISRPMAHWPRGKPIPAGGAYFGRRAMRLPFPGKERQAVKLLRQFNEVLGKYAYSPMIWNLLEDGAHLEWGPDERLVGTSSPALEESQYVLQVAELTRDGWIGSVLTCAHCSQWFYRRFKHQRFCSTACQQAHYRSTPEWKAHRAAWMREYRRTTAKPNVLTLGERRAMKDRRQ